MANYLDAVTVHQTGAHFPVRRMDFDLTGITPNFVDHDPVSSYLWMAFQCYFPEGEQFFVDAVRAAREQVHDPKLQQEISAFIGQEAMHGKEHRAANEESLRQGVDVSRLDRGTRRARLFLNRYAPMRFRLALIAAAEHFTAVIGAQVARREDFRRSIVDERIKALLLWHAMEEIEHRSVAFDVYRATGGDYATRVLAMAVVSAGIVPVVFYAMVFCLRQAGELQNLASWRRFLKAYWGSQGFFTQLLPEVLRYLRPDFHPNESDASILLATFRSELALLQR